jgi:predicted DNA binding protein
MSLFEVVFRVTYDSQLLEVSRELSFFKMYSWCNRKHDVFELVTRNPQEYSQVISKLPKPKNTIAESPGTEAGHFITKVCDCMNEKSTYSVVRHIGDLALLHLSPSMVEKGWEYHRIIAFKEKDFQELVERLTTAGVEVEILRKATFNDSVANSLTVSTDSLFSELTQRQKDALLVAFKAGYYKSPRKVNVASIAAKKHVPRTTFQEHLNKGENKLVTALAPYLQLYADMPESKQHA